MRLHAGGSLGLPVQMVHVPPRHRGVGLAGQKQFPVRKRPACDCQSLWLLWLMVEPPQLQAPGQSMPVTTETQSVSTWQEVSKLERGTSAHASPPLLPPLPPPLPPPPPASEVTMAFPPQATRSARPRTVAAARTVENVDMPFAFQSACRA